MAQAPVRVDSPSARTARSALENVCSGARIDCIAQHYSPDFIDHINDLELYGHAGVKRSVEMYRRMLSDMRIVIQDQVVDGECVATRFVVTGVSYGRPVSFNGITISRLRDGLIVEDWSVTDTIGMLRQLGAWRAFAILLRSLGKRSAAAPRLAAQRR